MPSAAVLVTTVRAIKHHGGVEDDPRVDRDASIKAIETGMANVRRHQGIIQTFGVPAVVTVVADVVPVALLEPPPESSRICSPTIPRITANPSTTAPRAPPVAAL